MTPPIDSSGSAVDVAERVALARDVEAVFARDRDHRGVGVDAARGHAGTTAARRGTRRGRSRDRRRRSRRRRWADTSLELRRDAVCLSRERHPRTRRTCRIVCRRVGGAAVAGGAGGHGPFRRRRRPGVSASPSRAAEPRLARAARAACRPAAAAERRAFCCCSSSPCAAVAALELTILRVDERGDLLQERDQRRLELFEGDRSSS